VIVTVVVTARPVHVTNTTWDFHRVAGGRLVAFRREPDEHGVVTL
jgi:hypothetical protein